jgi:hypothetical protein
MAFLTGIIKRNCEIHMEPQRTSKSQNILRKKHKAEGITLLISRYSTKVL